MHENMAKFQPLFLEKFDENIREIRLESASRSATSANIDSLVRRFHNIKSDAAMMGYFHISRLSRLVESMLRGGKFADDGPYSELLDDVADYFRVQCDGGVPDPDEKEVDALAARLEAVLETAGDC